MHRLGPGKQVTWWKLHVSNFILFLGTPIPCACGSLFPNLKSPVGFAVCESEWQCTLCSLTKSCLNIKKNNDQAVVPVVGKASYTSPFSPALLSNISTCSHITAQSITPFYVLRNTWGITFEWHSFQGLQYFDLTTNVTSYLKKHTSALSLLHKIRIFLHYMHSRPGGSAFSYQYFSNLPHKYRKILCTLLSEKTWMPAFFRKLHELCAGPIETKKKKRTKVIYWFKTCQWTNAQYVRLAGTTQSQS